MRKNIGIIDSGIGNISSVLKLVNLSGGVATVVNKESDFEELDKLILPGVGNFNAGMSALKAKDFSNLILNHVYAKGLQLLGICLGMQLLCRGSEEGSEPGLGLIDAEVIRFQFPPSLKLKVPHMGWNVVCAATSNPLIPHTEEEQRFYFVHSYKVVPDDPSVVIGTANYGGEFCAAFQQGNVFGVQFHPEKSHRFGMALMNRFCEL